MLIKGSLPAHGMDAIGAPGQGRISDAIVTEPQAEPQKNRQNAEGELNITDIIGRCVSL